MRVEEIVISVPGGRSITTLVNATPVLSEEGDVESFVVTLQDTTPLDELERLRADFLAMVSHELRTPLASVKGSVTTLLDHSATLDPAEARQFHWIIDQQTDRMRELIGDLLDVARIETGTLPVDPQPVDLDALLDQARNAFASSGGRHHVSFGLPPDLPWVMADGMRVVQVLANLLSNAARHSPESACIRVSAERDGVYVAVSVADEGQGMPTGLLPHLFRRFSRIDGDERRSGIAGSGLGWPSAGASWRPTGDASGPRATGRVKDPDSPSPFRWWKAVGAAWQPGPACWQPAPGPGRRCACWWWTTTPRRSGSSGTPSPRPATRRW